MQKNKLSSNVLADINKCVEDESWRVRKRFVEKLPDILGYQSKDEATQNFLDIIVRLIGDIEPEVKTAALKCLPKIIDRFHPSSVEAILDTFQTVYSHASTEKDTGMPVRRALASSIVSLGQVVKRVNPNSVKRVLVPMMKKFLDDEDAPVKLNFCNALEGIVRIVDAQTFQDELAGPILQIGKDTKYRARMAVVGNLNYLYAFYVETGGLELWKNSEFEQLLSVSFTDPAAAVRKAAAKALRGICKNEINGKRMMVNGWEYINSKADDGLMQTLLAPFAQDATANYHHRLTCIYFFKDLFTDVDSGGTTLKRTREDSLEMIRKQFQPILDASLTDEVPNVKVQALKAVIVMKELYSNDQAIKNGVEANLNDADGDVQYFARKANDWGW